MDKGKVLVGVIGAAQGIKGEVRVKSYTGDPRNLGAYGPLETHSPPRKLEVLGLRALKDDMVVVRFEGVADRTAAAALTGLKLYVDRIRLPPPDDEEFYQVDLIGLAAVTPDGLDLGQVMAVQNFGAGDLLEIARPVGQSILVPFTKAFVPVLDFEAGRIVIEPAVFGNEADDGEPGV